MIFNRNVSVEIEILDDTNVAKAVATMQNKTNVGNKVGKFKVEVMVNMENFEIIDVSDVVIDGLSPICAEAMPKVKSIIGLSITSGYSKKLKELVGGADGCTHIVELLIEIGRCIYQAHHNHVAFKSGYMACVEEFMRKSKVSCLGVSRYADISNEKK